MTHLRIDGHEIEVAFTPAPAGAPLLVFLHEGLGSADLWRDVPARIAEALGCGTLVYSRYGNGFSQPLEGVRQPSYMHDEALRVLPQLLDAFDLHEVVLIGQSDGASIALIFAGSHPRRVRAAVLEAPHVFVEERSVRGIAQARIAYESGDLRARLAKYHTDVDRTFWGWNDIWLSEAFANWNIEEYARTLRAPTLLVAGEGDEYGTFAQIEAILRGARDARVDALYLAACGHAPHRDRPSIVIPTIANFVRTACDTTP